jgi:hypothetical protein
VVHLLLLDRAAANKRLDKHTDELLAAVRSTGR